ncbi:SDR family NAD(P)-dependent oxidoreductase [Streptomyces sp. NPDC001312]|uniref:SDR family NAD(P)-dependent oxidoreductase n=1 Tax=Streptomyces sp. NPDC001312 TaxID=3364561 RepID=UPI0036CF8625
MNTLQNRVALVTGSSRGIGAGIAELFAAEGARVVLHGRDADALESVRAKIAAAGGAVLALTADLTRFDEIEALRTRTEAEFGPVDVLVTNAGGNPVRPGPIEEISEEGWHASIDANLTSTFLTVKSFLPGMKERGYGSIVTLSSAAARRPTPQSPFAYAAAKAGVELLTKCLAAQAGPHGIRVNCVAPETIMTERNERQIPAEIQRALVQSHPIRRLGTLEDVAQAALFLAADSASWISGVVIDVAGGSVLV